MYTAADFTQAYEDYVEFNRELIQKIGTVGSILGVFGFGPRPGRDEGHMKFLKEMEYALQQVVQEQPDPATADAIADVIFHARYVYEEESLSPYVFMAVEGITSDLFPFLSPEKAGELYNEYKKLPYRLRAPIYKNILAELEKTVKSNR